MVIFVWFRGFLCMVSCCGSFKWVHKFKNCSFCKTQIICFSFIYTDWKLFLVIFLWMNFELKLDSLLLKSWSCNFALLKKNVWLNFFLKNSWRSVPQSRVSCNLIPCLVCFFFPLAEFNGVRTLWMLYLMLDTRLRSKFDYISSMFI